MSGSRIAQLLKIRMVTIGMGLDTTEVHLDGIADVAARIDADPRQYHPWPRSTAWMYGVLYDVYWRSLQRRPGGSL